MSKAGIPETPRDEFRPFDPVVRPGDDAPMIEHLVGWQGATSPAGKSPERSGFVPGANLTGHTSPVTKLHR